MTDLIDASKHMARGRGSSAGRNQPRATAHRLPSAPDPERQTLSKTRDNDGPSKRAWPTQPAVGSAR